MTDYTKIWRGIAIESTDADQAAIESADDNATVTLREEGVEFPHYSDALLDDRYCKIAYLSYIALTEI